jgi:hypothetical protein
VGTGEVARWLCVSDPNGVPICANRSQTQRLFSSFGRGGMNGALQLKRFLLLSWLVKSVGLAMWAVAVARRSSRKKYTLCVMSTSKILRCQMWRIGQAKPGGLNQKQGFVIQESSLCLFSLKLCTWQYGTRACHVLSCIQPWSTGSINHTAMSLYHCRFTTTSTLSRLACGLG